VKLPIVVSKRSKIDKLYHTVEQERKARISAEQAAAKMGHRVRKGLLDLGDLAQELRLLTVHLTRSRERRSVRFEFELADDVLIEGFRRSDRGEYLRQAVAHHVEMAFYKNLDMKDLIR